MSRRQGLSLLEVVVALGLLTLVVFSSVVVYTGLIAGTSRADVNREAVAALDVLCDVWERRVREEWPTDPPPDPPAAARGDRFDRFVYSVEDLGRIENPLQAGSFLEMKAVVVRIEFEEQVASGETVTRSYRTRLLVAP